MKQAIDLLVERLDGLAPSIALVLGSGLGGLVDEVEDAVRIPYAGLPGFPRSGVTGHAGELVAGRFAGQPMADGEPMDPHDDNAASKTLPLGSRAQVTNLENGHSATVTIEDRGPFVKGRIIDVSPATARRLGISREEGVAPVRVVPLTPPPETAGGESAPPRQGGARDLDALR